MSENPNLPNDHADTENLKLVSRRTFLAAAGLGATVAAAPGLTTPAWAAKAPKAQATTQPSAGTTGVLAGDGIVVLVTLYGGNDGLDTVIPAADPAYQAARRTLAFQPAQVLALRDGLGLHPAMKRMHTMFGAGKLAVIQGVGYPNPNRSHFRSMDIWQTGVPETSEVTGWLGRWHDLTGPDPLRMVNVGASVPRAMISLKGGPASIPNGKIALPNPLVPGFVEQSRLTNELGPLGARIAASGNDLLRVRDKLSSTLTGTVGAGSTNLEGGAALSTEAKSTLDYQLDTVASIIASGAPTRVFSVSLGGFDTHASERDQHARLLGIVDGALGRFFDKMATQPNGSKVVAMVYSEFGRRVNANLSEGTDHGTAAPVFVLGAPVKGGLYGEQPSLTKLDSNGDMIFNVDFRSVYAQVSGSVLGIDPKALLPQVPVGSLNPLF
jgi:uncharacterized protein (DUF1501 family)